MLDGRLNMVSRHEIGMLVHKDHNQWVLIWLAKILKAAHWVMIFVDKHPNFTPTCILNKFALL